MCEEGHPLEYEWTMWYVVPGQPLKEMTTIQTVEDFWTLMHSLIPVSQLPVRADYYLFKKGIRPEWEDEINTGGGSWEVYPNLDQKGLDKIWTELWLAIIGEQFGADESTHICGVSATPRSQKVRFGVWTTTHEADDAVMSIGNNIKKIIHEYSPNTEYYYKIHGTDGKIIHSIKN